MAQHPERVRAHEALRSAVQNDELEIRYTEKVLSELKHHQWVDGGDVTKMIAKLPFVHQKSGYSVRGEVRRVSGL